MLKRRTTWFGILSVIGILAASIALVSGCATSVQNKAKNKQVATPQQVASSTVDAQNAGELQNTDCIKCHDSEPKDIATNGGKHKTAVSCLDCHEEHPPSGTNTIPECSNCHEGEAHFQLDNCLVCHSNPHTPLNLTIPDQPSSNTACFTCHPEKEKEFKAKPSKHSTKNCTFCHPAKHKAIDKCLTCHEPHADTMVYEDCLRCHKPHSPTDITYADDTPSVLCGACHPDLLESLTHNPSKHQKLACAYCHKNRHPTVPKCSDCHAQPHDKGMLTQFSDCLQCHKDPHDLVF